MSYPNNPFVRGYHGLSVERLLAISYDDDCPLTYLPLHASQSHLPDSQVMRYPCIFSDDFALITEGQDVPPVSLSVVRAHVRRQAAGALGRCRAQILLPSGSRR